MSLDRSSDSVHFPVGVPHVVNASSDVSCLQRALEDPSQFPPFYWKTYLETFQKLLPTANFQGVQRLLADPAPAVPSLLSSSTASHMTLKGLQNPSSSQTIPPKLEAPDSTITTSTNANPSSGIGDNASLASQYATRGLPRATSNSSSGHLWHWAQMRQQIRKTRTHPSTPHTPSPSLSASAASPSLLPRLCSSSAFGKERARRPSRASWRRLPGRGLRTEEAPTRTATRCLAGAKRHLQPRSSFLPSAKAHDRALRRSTRGTRGHQSEFRMMSLA
jgi:hypothetical protein